VYLVQEARGLCVSVLRRGRLRRHRLQGARRISPASIERARRLAVRMQQTPASEQQV